MVLGAYLIGALFLMELVLRGMTIGNIGGVGFFYSLLLIIPVVVMVYSVCTFVKERMAYWIGVVFLGGAATLYASQLIYYKIFKMFYTTYSVGNAGQVMSFWKEALVSILQNLHLVIILYIPLFLFLWKGRQWFVWVPQTYSKIIGILGVLCIYALSVGTLRFDSEGENSVYQLYYHQRNPIVSVDKLGLLTTMRLDLQRTLSGWEGQLYEEEEEVKVGETIVEEVIEDVVGQSQQEEQVSEMEEEIGKEEEVAVVTKLPQVMPIDFDKFTEESSSEEMKAMHQYFKHIEPTTTNAYTGQYAGYNLILLTAEAFSPYAVDEALTPTLYKLVHEGINFTNFYNPIWEVSTSDGEYAACTGLIPKQGVWSFYKSGDNYMPFVMGNQLQNKGYTTKAYHNHTYDYYKRHISHPNMGYAYKGLGNGLEVKKTWPESDLEMMEKTVNEYIGSEPFHTYYMTVSGHMNYNFTGNAMSYKNKELVKDLPLSEAGKAYIACQIELDRALEYLLQVLGEQGVLDRTLIALSADHYPYGLENNEIEELAGKEIEENFELYKSTFILYTPTMTPTVIEKPCSSIDVLPTLLNLMGLTYDSRLLMGRDILSEESPLVIFYNKSFITDKGFYDARTKTFMPTTSEGVTEAYVKEKVKEVSNKFHYSAKILDTNYYGLLLDPEY